MNTEFPYAPVKTDTPEDAFRKVLAEAGATLPVRDSVDRRVVEQVKNKTGKVIDTQKDVGGWPVYQMGAVAPDSDNDGMPDEWETRYGLDPKDPSDGNKDVDRDGYTNIEEFLNSTDPKGRTDRTGRPGGAQPAQPNHGSARPFRSFTKYLYILQRSYRHENNDVSRRNSTLAAGQHRPGGKRPPQDGRQRRGIQGRCRRLTDSVLLKDYDPKSSSVVSRAPFLIRAKFPVIDVHTHMSQSKSRRRRRGRKTRCASWINKTSTSALFPPAPPAKTLTGRWSCLRRIPSVSSCGAPLTPPTSGTRITRNGRSPSWSAATTKRARGLGEITDKGSGLQRDGKLSAGKRMHVDDPRMDPIWAKCAELGMPINLHIADHHLRRETPANQEPTPFSFSLCFGSFIEEWLGPGQMDAGQAPR